MASCDSFQFQLLDHLYGLLDEEDGRVLSAHIAGCPACQAAALVAEAQRQLLGAAARAESPGVAFQPPVEADAAPEPRVLRLPQRPPSLQRWGRWAAAAVILVVAGLAGAMTWSHGNTLRGEVTVANAAKDKLAKEREREKTERLAREKQEQDTIRSIQDEIDRLSNERKKSRLQVRITAPSTAQAGGHTEAAIYTENLLGSPVPANVDVTLREEKSGKLVFEKKGMKTPDGWCKVVFPPLPQKPGTQYGMQVVARRDNGARVEVAAEKLRLVSPLYLTHLTTDKPMYQPGEVVSFRSLTLERFALTPVAKPVFLAYRITAPSGAQVFAVTGTDQLRQGNQNWAAVLGPDRKPVRGIGTGAYQIPADAPGGQYALTVGVTVSDDAGKPFLVQEQSRTFIVNKYEKPRLTKELEFTRKSYGAGEEVVAACRVARVEGGAPLANKDVKATVQVDGKTYDAAGKPVKDANSGIALKTDARGNVNVRFKLPTRIDIGDASLTVSFTDGASHETLVRPIPVVLKKLRVELYPEGGDLVAGPSNRLYFQARTPLGKPAEMKGRIVDPRGKVIANVATLTDDKEAGVNQGMGVVELAGLKAGAAYELKIDAPPGIEGRFLLPEVKTDGIALSIPDLAANDKISVGLRNGGKKRDLLVGAYCRGRLVASSPVTLDERESAKVDLAPQADAGGVFRITVFERKDAKQLQPIAERLIYRKSARKLDLKVRSDKKDYSPGERVKLFIQAATETGTPAPAIALLAVVDQRVVSLADEKTARSMPTQFYLMTEVRDPEDLEHADFLLGDHPRASQALDLLLGTQGWRRFAEQKPIDEFKKLGKKAAEHLVRVSGQDPLEKGKFVQPEVVEQDSFQPKIEKLAKEKETRLVQAQRSSQEHWQKISSTAAALARTERAIREASDKVQAYWAQVRTVSLFVLAGLLAALAIAALAVGLVRASNSGNRVVPYISAGACSFALFAGTMVLALSSAKTNEFPPQMAEAMNPRMNRGDDGAARREQKWEDQMDGNGLGMPPPAPAAAEGAVLGDVPMAVRHLAPNLAQGMPRPVVAPFGVVANGGAREQARGGDGKEMLQQRAGLRVELQEPRVRRAMGLEKKEAADMMMGAKRRLRDDAMMAPFVVREYAHQHKTAKDSIRTDFTETLFWHPVLVLPDGKGEVSFDLCDSVTSFQVLAYTHTLDGRLGSLTTAVKSRLPFTLEPKVPLEVTATDKIVVPLSIGNATNLPRSVDLQVEARGLRQDGAARQHLDVGPEKSVRRLFRFQPSIVEGAAALVFRGQCAPFAEDRIERQFTVVPDGFPTAGFHSEQLEKSDRFKVALPATWLKGTLKVQAQVYPSTLADLQKGLESLLREPNGCFEQASTSNYPNVLILDYLKENDKTNPEIVRRVRQLLDSGYTKLTQYECDAAERKKKGYEWFGGSAPPHEALTAYGLLQFRDMARVYPVDKTMIERTRAYLMSQKDGKGGFKRNPRALDTFGGAPAHITNAYIVWSLTEGGGEDNVTAELAVLTEQARTSKDPYFLALVANSLLNRSKAAEAKSVLQALVKAQSDDGHLDGAETSITRSGGRDLQIEATALTVLAWLKANHPSYAPSLRKAVAWIGKQRGGYGGFGSTQSTILALKALIAYTRANKKTAEAGELTLTVNGKVVDRKVFAAGAEEALVVTVPDADKVLNPGANNVEVAITGKNSFPYTLSWSYRTLKPANGAKCPVQLATRLDRNETAEADSVRLSATVENKSGQNQGMTVAIVGLPAGLTVPEDMKQLKTYMKPRSAGKGGVSRYISFYEIRGRELVLYWRDLAKDEKVEIGLDLVCRVPGEYRGPASRAYLYYNADDKFWTDPLQVRINAKDEN